MEVGLVNVRIDKNTAEKIREINIINDDGVRMLTFEQKIAHITSYFIKNNSK